MFRIGIDVGSTYTKYCIMDDEKIQALFSEETPLHQEEYFSGKIDFFNEKYANPVIVSCGYGKKNVHSAVKQINELTALAKGSFFLTKEASVILDIGGQDTKIIKQSRGLLSQFFINDKCAAGSGMFLSSTLDRIGYDFQRINLEGAGVPAKKLSSVCAVFAQSEIVDMVAANKSEEEIINAVIWQIISSANKLLTKVDEEKILLSGGMTLIPGFADYAELVLGRECNVLRESPFLSAIGCAVCG